MHLNFQRLAALASNYENEHNRSNKTSVRRHNRLLNLSRAEREKRGSLVMYDMPLFAYSFSSTLYSNSILSISLMLYISLSHTRTHARTNTHTHRQTHTHTHTRAHTHTHTHTHTHLSLHQLHIYSPTSLLEKLTLALFFLLYLLVSLKIKPCYVSCVRLTRNCNSTRMLLFCWF